MRTYNISNRLSRQARAEVERIIDTHENYKKSFFFRPSQNAYGRRRNEEKFAQNNPNVAFILNNDETLVVEQSYSESCSHVYYRLYARIETKNGSIYLQNISALKKLIK